MFRSLFPLTLVFLFGIATVSGRRKFGSDPCYDPRSLECRYLRKVGYKKYYSADPCEVLPESVTCRFYRGRSVADILDSIFNFNPFYRPGPIYPNDVPNVPIVPYRGGVMTPSKGDSTSFDDLDKQINFESNNNTCDRSIVSRTWGRYEMGL